MEEINSNVADSDDDLDWEEVQVPEHQYHLEITLQTQPKPDKNTNKKKGIPHAERLLRIDCHKIHTVALIVNARVRNKWINDHLLHARLLSLTPLHLQTAFSLIHKSRIPNHNQRGRMFEAAMKDLTEWWVNSFEVLPEGHIRSRTFDEVRRGLEVRGLHLKDENNPDAIIDIDTLQDMVDDEIEPIRSPNSLMKHALMRNGSRDVSAQLFTALCRGLGIPARLVVSLQSVPWQAGVGKPKPIYERKPKGKGKQKALEVEDDEDASNSNSMMDSDVQSGFSKGRRLDGGPVKSDKAKGKEPAKPVIKLRKTKSRGQILGGPSNLATPDPLITPPVIWTEVFSRPDARWLPIDPIRGHINDRKVFDPTPSNINTSMQRGSTIYPHRYAANNIRSTGTKVENRMVYVLAFEEDGYGRDVTRRYAREYSAKVAKVQGGSSAPNVGGGGKGRQAWWSSVINAIHRPFRLHRDDLEDQELEAAQMMEGMPTTMGGFKDHPIYVLVRHLKQTETIHPPPPATPELGKFRGEPVYPRSSVVSLKTAENWMRNAGRTVIAGQQPMKMVKIRAGTVNRMRELEVLKDELRVAGQDGPNGPNGQNEGSSSTTGEIMQGLYAYSQTESYVPDPVVDGKVPKNNFGNIDLYVPSMLPKGAVHVPFKGVAKIARKLGFDFAEAVTGFEFKKRRAFPIIEGVVVAAENEATLLEAFWEADREAEEKARIKREDRVIKHWKRLIHGLQIRQRLQEQYGNKPRQKPLREGEHDPNDNEDESREGSPREDDNPSSAAGGFIAGADRVVQAFHLPKNTHVTLSHTPTPTREIRKLVDELEEPATSDAPAEFIAPDFVTMDIDSDTEETVGLPAEQVQTDGYIPKRMQEMAEEHAARQQQLGSDADNDFDVANDSGDEAATSPQASVAARPTRKSKKQATVKITLPSKASASTPSNLSNTRSTKAKTNKKSPTTATLKRKRRTSRRKMEEESDSADSSLIDEEDQEDSKEQQQPSPSKRVRVRVAAKVKSTPVAITPSTRTLRPRIFKMTAQIDEEEKQDEDDW